MRTFLEFIFFAAFLIFETEGLIFILSKIIFYFSGRMLAMYYLLGENEKADFIKNMVNDLSPA